MLRLLPLALLLLTAIAPAQTTGRHFQRASRLPATPAASPVVEASAHTQSAPAPLQKMRSGRPWPRYSFGRLPQTTSGAAVQAVDASAKRGVPHRRGFWRAPR